MRRPPPRTRPGRPGRGRSPRDARRTATGGPRARRGGPAPRRPPARRPAAPGAIRASRGARGARSPPAPTRPAIGPGRRRPARRPGALLVEVDQAPAGPLQGRPGDGLGRDPLRLPPQPVGAGIGPLHRPLEGRRQVGRGDRARPGRVGLAAREGGPDLLGGRGIPGLEGPADQPPGPVAAVAGQGQVVLGGEHAGRLQQGRQPRLGVVGLLHGVGAGRAEPGELGLDVGELGLEAVDGLGRRRGPRRHRGRFPRARPHRQPGQGLRRLAPGLVEPGAGRFDPGIQVALVPRLSQGDRQRLGVARGVEPIALGLLGLQPRGQLGDAGAGLVLLGDQPRELAGQPRDRRLLRPGGPDRSLARCSSSGQWTVVSGQ